MTHVRSEPGDAAAQTELLARLRAGDEAAFEILVKTNAGRLLATARKFFRREEDAQDAVQDAFLVAFRNLDQFDGRSMLSTWLYRVGVNACLMRLRSQRAKGGLGGVGGGTEASLDALLPTFQADGHQTRSSKTWKPTESAGIESAELRGILRDKIEELPEVYREVLMLRDIEGLSTEEAGEVLKMTPAAVKTRLHRARQALKTLIEPYFTG